MESIIYWRTDDKRNGTVLPDRGERWEDMLQFLRDTGAEHIFAYRIREGQEDMVIFEGK